jgi:hypothetical protein
MARTLLISLLCALTFFPYGANAELVAEKETSKDGANNVYIFERNSNIVNEVAGDLSIIGASVGVYGTVAGDVLATAGTLVLGKEIKGDARLAGLDIQVHENVSGDIMAIGNSLSIYSHSKHMYLVGRKVQVTGGAEESVVIYGADVTLEGEYMGNVEVIASNTFTLKDNTHIHGTLRYNAPTVLTIPKTSNVLGTTTYTGAYSYVPTDDEAKTFALAGAGVFLLVRVLSAMIVAALCVGLFPRFTHLTVDTILQRKFRLLSLFALLGFAIAISAPILILILLASFVGIGSALIILPLYIFLLLLSYVYVGISIGAYLRRKFLYKIYGSKLLTFKDAVIGTGIFYLLRAIPYIGTLLFFIAMTISIGAIATLTYRFIFAKDVTYGYGE